MAEFRLLARNFGQRIKSPINRVRARTQMPILISQRWDRREEGGPPCKEARVLVLVGYWIAIQINAIAVAPMAKLTGSNEI